MATTAINLNDAKYKYRRTVGDQSPSTTYGLELSLGGKNYTFIPNSVVSKGVSTAKDQYVLPWFLDRTNLKTLGEVGIPVDTADFPQFKRDDGSIADYLKNKAGASTQGVLVPSGSLKFDGNVRTFKKETGAVVGMGERGGQLVYLQDRGGAADKYMRSDGITLTVPQRSNDDDFFGGFFDDIVGGVSDFFSGIDDAVNEIPGGWGTVALVGGGAALANVATSAATTAGAGAGTGLTLGGGGLGLSAGGTGLGITAGSAGAGTIGAGLGTTLAGVTTGVSAGAGLLGSGAGATTTGAGTGLTTGGVGTGLTAGSSGTGLTAGGSGLGLTTGGGLGLTTGSAGAGSIGAGLGTELAGINTGIGTGAGAVTGGTIGGGMTPVDYSLGTAGTGTVGGTGVTSSVLSAISKATGISVDDLKTFAPSVIQGLLSATGSYLTSEQGKDAATINAKAITDAATIAADAARFRPVGVTTRFGSSNFTTDAAGNVITAGYTPSAEITGYQDRLRTLAGQGMTDIEGARAAYQPLTGAAQNLFSLGKSYLAKTPEQAAQDYITKQTALLTPSRETRLADIRNNLFQTGRTGSATSQGGSLMNTNPELAAYYNSLVQQDLTLATQADQEARNRITFGSGLFDTGANLQGRYYTGQTAAYSPFTTAMDTSSGLERLAQQPLDLSTSIGQKVSTANANVGQLTSQGIINAANVMAPANAYSLGGNLLSGVAGSPNVTSALNKAFGNTPQPTQQTYTYDPVTKQFIPVQQSVFGT